MDSSELRRAIRSDSELFARCNGVYPYDLMLKKQIGISIVNLDGHKQPGSHWVVVNTMRNGVAEVFDSYSGIPAQLQRQLKDYDTTFSNKQVQGSISTTCGQHSLFYCYHRCRGVGFTQILKTYTNDTEENDRMVCRFVEDTFSIETQPIDEDFMMVQLSRALKI